MPSTPGRRSRFADASPPPPARAAAYIDGDGGAVVQRRIEPASDGAFSIALQAPSKPGRYFVSVDVEDAVTRWQQPAVLIPLFVDVPEPDGPDEMIVHPPANPERSRFIDRFLSRYNEARAARGLPPLKVNGVACELAEARARLHASDENTPLDGELIQRLAARGVVVRHESQVQGAVEFVDEAAWWNLQNPARHAAIVDPKLTEIGIGFAPGKAGLLVYVQYLLGH